MITLPSFKGIVKPATAAPAAPVNRYGDDFSSSVFNPLKWVQGAPVGYDSSVGVAQSGGELVITPRTNQSGLHYGGLLSANNLNFADQNCSIELTNQNNATTTAYPEFGLSTSSDDTKYLHFVIYQATLTARVSTASGVFTDTNVSYDTLAHRFLRLSHDSAANLIHFETSPTGLEGSWSTIRSLAPPFVLTSMRINIQAGTFQVEANAHPVSFDNFASSFALY